MKLHFSCYKCGSKYTTDSSNTGKKCKCKKCGTLIIVQPLDTIKDIFQNENKIENEIKTKPPEKSIYPNVSIFKNKYLLFFVIGYCLYQTCKNTTPNQNEINQKNSYYQSLVFDEKNSDVPEPSGDINEAGTDNRKPIEINDRLIAPIVSANDLRRLKNGNDILALSK
jgi:hypothetical protein